MCQRVTCHICHDASDDNLLFDGQAEKLLRGTLFITRHHVLSKPPLISVWNFFVAIFSKHLIRSQLNTYSELHYCTNEITKYLLTKWIIISSSLYILVLQCLMSKCNNRRGPKPTRRYRLYRSVTAIVEHPNLIADIQTKQPQTQQY
jgi:hypothetical protein